MSLIDIEAAISQRSQAIRVWLGEEAPHVADEQKHLDAGTPERAYWHYGYQSALRDVLALMEGKQLPGEVFPSLPLS